MRLFILSLLNTFSLAVAYQSIACAVSCARNFTPPQLYTRSTIQCICVCAPSYNKNKLSNGTTNDCLMLQDVMLAGSVGVRLVPMGRIPQKHLLALVGSAIEYSPSFLNSRQIDHTSKMKHNFSSTTDGLIIFFRPSVQTHTSQSQS